MLPEIDIWRSAAPHLIWVNANTPLGVQFVALQSRVMGAEMANLKPADVGRIIGSIEDHETARIIGTGATAADLRAQD